MNEILRIEKLSKTFLDGSGNQLEILQAMDFSFPQGKSISIVGRSGTGKSTLLQLLGGLDRPTQGNILFQDEDIFSFSSDRLSNWRNRHVGFVFQAHHLLPDFSALENVLLPAMIMGVKKEVYHKRALELLSLVQLEDRVHHKPSQLSGGEQQRVAIARSLINAPDLLLTDEPTGNLDVHTGDVVGQLLLDICKETQITLITVTHNPQLAAAMDLQLELTEGKLVETSQL
ncbi:MAG: lipoprotein-releasing system ATP-binding protein LolD [SAR324 cluster bacterium]|uniref:Lipoprotein-releasing system ATP-binding protein LolD n=1 Tax=SAR324 cluster bacterium TaxID=2024889 RepID=A0A2A4TAB4_9DELT|nr:MAG: lipoprotein-releasing system ATP-binding protein LolD [SAR324 cluster bacterium]